MTHIETILVMSHHPMYPRQMQHSPEACHSEQDSTVFTLATLGYTTHIETILFMSHHPMKPRQMQLCLVACHPKKDSVVIALATLDIMTHIETHLIVSHHPMYPRQMKHSPEACHSTGQYCICLGYLGQPDKIGMFLYLVCVTLGGHSN
jgi:hypothetical protein